MNDQIHTSRSLPAWAIGLLLVLAALLAYQPAWHGEPIFDDYDHLTPPELSSVGGLVRIWTELDAAPQYYPVTHSVFWLQNRLWGDAMFGYHIVNILLHGLAALLLGRILQRLEIPGAWLAAAIFALHPVHTESVAWISELKNTLSAVFYLGAAAAYLRYDASRQRNDYWLALALFVCGLGSKSVTATLPAALLVVFWWKRGVVSWPRDVRPLLPFFGLGVAAGLFTAWVERTVIGATGDALALGIVDRILVAGRVPWFYLSKLLWPADLIFIYPRWRVDAAAAWQYLFPLATLLLIAAAWWMRRRSRAPLAAILFFGGTLVPVLGFLNVYPFVYSFVADHYQYLASIGIIALVAAGVALALRRWRVWGTPVGHLACAALVVGLAALTWRQSRNYANMETLWQTTIAQNPDCWVGHSNLANFYLERGDTAAALRHARSAVALRPQSAEARINLGSALRQTGDEGGALAEFRRAVEIRPDLAVAHYNVGTVMLARGDLEAAKQSLETAVTLRPEFVNARNNLAAILLDQGKIDEALTHIEAARAIFPDDPDTNNNLANAWLRRGDPERAAHLFGAVLRRDPANAVASTNLGVLLLQTGRIEEARAHLERAVAQLPDSAQLHASLGSALFAQQRVPEAIKHFERSLQLRPNDAATHNDLASALLQTDNLDRAYNHFLKAVELQPELEAAQFNLGYMLLQNGRAPESIERFEKALALKPDFADAHYQLGNALLQTGKLDAAVAHLEQTVALQPEFANGFNDLGVALVQRGDAAGALARFQRALELDGQFAQAHTNAGRVLAQMGRASEAATHFQAALKLQKDDLDALLNLAWLLSTANDASVRNGQHAIFLTHRALRLPGGEHPAVLRTLAAAFAEAGRFAEAVGAAEHALQLLEGQPDPALAANLQAELKLYRAGEPFRHPPASGPVAGMP